MAIAAFVIPLNREDLLSAGDDGQYYVHDVTHMDDIPRHLADCNTALVEDGFLFILNHFDPIFSALHLARELATKHLLSAHNIVLRGMTEMIQSLPTLTDDMDMHLREKLLNSGKMYLFLLSEALRALEERFNSKTEKELAVDAKSRKKAMKNFVDFDWDEKRIVSLIKLHDFVQQPLQKLWDPPVAEEDFVNLAANCCYKILEDPQVSQARLLDMKIAVFEILGTLILRYGHGLSCTVKLVQLMKLYEHLPVTLAEAAVKFVTDYQTRNFVREVIREITQAETAFDNSSPKACSQFLVEVARIGPEIMLPSMPLLLPELESDSYMMRNCVLGVIGEIVAQSLTKERLSEEQKETRDIFLEHLEDHLLDINAFVRGKVLKIWQRLYQEKAVPLSRLSQFLDNVILRLEDASWTVTRGAVQLYHSLLQSNPFGDKLEIHKLRQKLDEEEQLMARLEKEMNLLIPPSRAKQWEEVAPKVIVVLQDALSAGESEEDVPESSQAPVEQNIKKIYRFLLNEEYLKAYHLLRLTEKLHDTNKRRGDKQLEWLVDYYLNILRKIFVQFDENAVDGRRQDEGQVLTAEQKEAREKLLRQRTLTQYLKDCIVFAEQLEKATKIISNLLFSAQPSVILDALEFLTAAYQFGLEGALTGVQNMLSLVWSSESSVKEGVAASYRQLYLSVTSNAVGRSRAGEIVRNLSMLLKTLDEDQQPALEVLLREWVRNGEMDKECIQIMWERFSMKLPDTSEDDSKAALILLAMVGGASPNILKTNIPVLVSVGLGERGRKDYKLVKETCRALLKLVPENTSVTSNEEPYRLQEQHEIFQVLCSILMEGFNGSEDKDYTAMAYEAIDVIYQLSEHPDKICTTLLNEFTEMTKKAFSSGAFDELLGSSGNSEAMPKSTNSTIQSHMKVPVEILNNYIFFIGHIAFRQWVHLDRAVFRELKRRNRIRELEAEKKRDDNQKKKNKDKRKSQANLNSSFISRASETPRLRKEKEDAADAEIGEVNADDAEADYINHVCESEVVTCETLLAKLFPVVVTVCSNPQKYKDTHLQSTACFALTKLMLVSSALCEKHLALVFTMMEKSPQPQTRSNLVYAVGDLANRFPNLIEPWTKHLYARLQDRISQVRLDTIVVLKHLITNEMVKVRGQISDMALCIVDAEETISVMAREFFRDLSKKGNTLYNVMPDIISRLSNPCMNVPENQFHAILEFLLPLIHKDKQMESLVDKLCQRFRASTTERQWSDIAFCLTLIQYSDRSLRRLTENFSCYSDKLNSEKVYESFESIIGQALKTNKPERKVLVEELQAKINECMKRGLGEEPQDVNVSGEADGSQKENRVVFNRKERNSKGKQKPKNQRKSRRKASKQSSDEEEDEEEDDDSSDNGTPQQLKARHRNKRRR